MPLGRLDGYIYYFPGIYSIVVPYHDIYDFYFSGHICLSVNVSYQLLAVLLYKRVRQGHERWLFWLWTLGFGSYVYFMVTSLFTHYFIDCLSGIFIAILFSSLAEQLSWLPDVLVFGTRGEDRYMLRHKACPKCGWANARSLVFIGEDEKKAQAIVFRKRQND